MNPLAPSPSALRRILAPAPPVRAGEKCEMCAEPIPDEHSHLVDLQQRSLLCTCRGCALLFTNPGAGRGRYRPVPDRVLREPGLALSPAEWDELQIPVRLAFFFHSTGVDRVVAFYPSPAGATESELPLGAWERGLGASRLASLLEPDVEALLVRGTDAGYGALLVPIDACYELVGLVRKHWRGFDGGTEAWEAIDAFFARLEDRSREP